MASAPAKISFCVKKTQPALKRGKAGYDNKMKFFISKPGMLAQKPKSFGVLFFSPAKEINAVFWFLTVGTCYSSAFWGNKLLTSLCSFTAVHSLKMSLSDEGSAGSIYLNSAKLICVNSLQFNIVGAVQFFLYKTGSSLRSGLCTLVTHSLQQQTPLTLTPLPKLKKIR